METDNADINVRLMFFARARELAGCSDAEMNVPAGTTTATVRLSIVEKFPELKAILPTCLISVNLDYSDPEKPVALRRGDEIGVISPVSGG